MSYNIESEIINIIKSLEGILKNETDYNVIIHVGEEPNFKEFHAHSNILRGRSNHFNEILSLDNIEKDDGKYIIKKPKITPQSFNIILEYLYTGYININNETGTELLLNIMIASDELKLGLLTKLAEEFIITGNHQFLRNDPIGILQTINDHKIFVKAKEFYLETVCSEPKILFNSDKFTQLSSSILEDILKRDDLKLDEVEIWKNLIKWGLAQDQTFNNEVSNWNQEDINTFKNIIQKFVPLIRFYGISSKDYIIEVKPYEEILPKELKDDLFKYYMIPEYEPTLNNLTPRYSKIVVDSEIVNQQHAILFANWIDQKGKNSRYIKTIPYEFNLIYRANRDGWTPLEFHEKCDKKEATIVIAKIKNSEQIIGGYNPLQWDSSGVHKSTKDSFIFSFTNRNFLQSAKVGYSNGDAYSIGCYLNNGPLFGGNNNNDLVYNSNGTWKSKNPISYSKVDIPSNFRADDYEVFQIINKKVKIDDVLKKETEIPEVIKDSNICSGNEEILETESMRDDKIKKHSIISLFKGKK